MVDKLVVGPISKGLKTDVTPFNIDNDSFPTLINAYQWRGRVKRKRGTSLLCRLQRYFNSNGLSWTNGIIIDIVLNGAGEGNIITGLLPEFGLMPNANIVPGSVIIIDRTTNSLYIDPGKDSILIIFGPGTPVGIVNYANGDISIPFAAGHTVAAVYIYNSQLPVMGLEDVNLNPNDLPTTMAFDTVYSYLIQQTSPYQAYDVTWYKNPATNGSYVAKTLWTKFAWKGQNYQQFWTTNYEGALFATNGVTVPFIDTNKGMQYAPSIDITFIAVTPTTLTVTIANCPLVIGDFVFVNEWVGSTQANSDTLNFLSGYVTAAAPNTPALALKTITITFPNATIAADAYTPGIIQYLTNRSDVTKDCIRWFDGDPTDGNPNNPTLLNGKGWVNFCPPLSRRPYSIAALPEAQYYLVGAKMIVPFKDRLLCLGPVVQTSAAGSQIYLQDVVIYSQNGTPYYTASFSGDPSLATTDFTSQLTPINETAIVSAWWEDETGFGGFLKAGVTDSIITCSPNEDVLIVGFTGFQTRLVYSGDDLLPFNFYLINSEYGSASTFSFINMDKGIITKGNRGYIITNQVGAERIDVQIPDEIFEIKLTENGNERICAQRDFINEWIYFTYRGNQSDYIFPNQSLFFNYRDNSYAIMNESYTTYGQFKKATGLTWATVGQSLPIPQWNAWNTPWNSGSSTVLQPDIIGGNAQGFVMIRDDRSLSATTEGTSLYIHTILGNTITSPNHCLNNGDYIYITGALFFANVGSSINGQIFQVVNPDNDTFQLNPTVTVGTYLGGGLITRMYVPFIQTKQFPLGWSVGKKTNLGSQLYLLTKTDNGQITVQIYLSQNDQFPYNTGSIVPAIAPVNNSLIYSANINTCPERIVNAVFKISIGNIGDGVTLIYNLNFQTMFNIIGSIAPGTLSITIGNVAIFTDDGIGGFTAIGTGTSVSSSVDYNTGQITLAFTVAPLSQPSISTFNYYAVNIISPSQASQSQIWHRMNTSLIGDTVQLGFTLSDAQMRDTAFSNQFTEIELHGFIIDVSPSQVLA